MLHLSCGEELKGANTTWQGCNARGSTFSALFFSIKELALEIMKVIKHSQKRHRTITNGFQTLYREERLEARYLTRNGAMV